MDIFIQTNNDKLKTNTNVSKQLRVAVWDMFAGPNKLKFKCCLCNQYEMNKNQVRQWEAAHIVAKKFHTNKPCRYDLVPSCPGCNNECTDLCIFDYLWCRERYGCLKRIIKILYRAFQDEDPNRFEEQFENQAWLMLKHFYAGKQFRVGGGLQNKEYIYQLAQSVQMQDEKVKIDKYTEKLEKSLDIVKRCCKRVKIY